MPQAEATLTEGLATSAAAELKWLGEELGRVRDADVLLGLLEAKANALTGLRALEWGV